MLVGRGGNQRKITSVELVTMPVIEVGGPDGTAVVCRD